MSSTASLQVTFLEKRAETPDIQSFIFTRPQNLAYRPGQYLVMDFGGDGNPRDRMHPFSFSSSPTEKDIVMVSTRVTTRLDSSPFKRRLNALEKGDTVTIRAPLGRFVLHDDHSKDAVMLTGGIGVTPVRSMIKFATDTSLVLGITLLYSNRIPEDIPFRDELGELQRRNPKLKIVHTVTAPEYSKEKWDGCRGRIDEKIIKENLRDPSNSVFYISGPPGMVEGLAALLKQMNTPPENIRTESFAGYE